MLSNVVEPEVSSLKKMSFSMRLGTTIRVVYDEDLLVC